MLIFFLSLNSQAYYRKVIFSVIFKFYRIETRFFLVDFRMYRSKDSRPSWLPSSSFHGLWNFLHLLGWHIRALALFGLRLHYSSILHIHWHPLCSRVSSLVTYQWQNRGCRKSCQMVERHRQTHHYHVNKIIFSLKIILAFLYQGLGLEQTQIGHVSLVSVSSKLFLAYTKPP